MEASKSKGSKVMQMRCLRVVVRMAVVIMAAYSCAMPQAQNTYQPKFANDPARSEAEASALGYMRTVIHAQKLYERKNGKYASSLLDLVHTGNFTRRMTNTDRGDYTVSFRSRKDGYELTLTPKQQDAEHRSFYANEDGAIHADETKTADEDSPKVK